MGAITTASRVSDISSFACIEPYLWSQGHHNDTWFYHTSFRENDRPEYVGHKIFVKKLDPYRSLYVYLKPKDDIWGEITRFLIALSKPSRKSFRFPKSYRFVVGFFFHSTWQFLHLWRSFKRYSKSHRLVFKIFGVILFIVFLVQRP